MRLGGSSWIHRPGSDSGIVRGRSLKPNSGSRASLPRPSPSTDPSMVERQSPVPLAVSVAVTGASGFLGRYLAPWLAARGPRVRAVTRGRNLPEGTGIEVFFSSATPEASEWTRAFVGCSAVLHLAGRAHIMEESTSDPLAAYRIANVEGTRRALEGAAAAGCRTFVFASSVKAVGERSTVPWTEATAPHPVDPYGVSKLEAERLVVSEGARLGIRTVSIRFPAIYGPGMRANMLRLFRAVARGVPLPFGRIANRRSLLFVGNAAAVLETVMTRADAVGCYFVSDEQDVSTPELVRAIARAFDRRPWLIPVPPALFRVAGKIGDRVTPWLPWPLTSDRVQRLMDSLQVDPRRIREELGFTPPYSMEEGMRETVSWFASRGMVEE